MRVRGVSAGVQGRPGGRCDHTSLGEAGDAGVCLLANREDGEMVTLREGRGVCQRPKLTLVSGDNAQIPFS